MPKLQTTKPKTIMAVGPSTTIQQDFITVKEAAVLLKLSEISIRRFLTQKKLRRFKVGARTLIRQTEAMSLIREAQ